MAGRRPSDVLSSVCCRNALGVRQIGERIAIVVDAVAAGGVRELTRVVWEGASGVIRVVGLPIAVVVDAVAAFRCRIGLVIVCSETATAILAVIDQTVAIVVEAVLTLDVGELEPIDKARTAEIPGEIDRAIAIVVDAVAALHDDASDFIGI